MSQFLRSIAMWGVFLRVGYYLTDVNHRFLLFQYLHESLSGSKLRFLFGGVNDLAIG